MTRTRFYCAALFLCVLRASAFVPFQVPECKRISSNLCAGANEEQVTLTRGGFLATLSSTIFAPAAANAFTGNTGAGGLGKTRPETGVAFLNEASVPVQQKNGDVLAEILVNGGNTPVLVSYNSPWPLLDSSSGIETRNLQEPESAFVFVANGSGSKSLSKQFFADTIFGSGGKYGAYGAPSDISVKPVVPDMLYLSKFTTLTPGMRESEREVYVATRKIGSSVVMLVTGSTAVRFGKKKDMLRQVAESFQVVESPKSSLVKAK